MFLLQMDKNPLSLASMHYCLNNSNNDNFNSNFFKTPHNLKKTCLNTWNSNIFISLSNYVQPLNKISKTFNFEQILNFYLGNYTCRVLSNKIY